MITSHFRSAFRNLFREKGGTIINISGLSLGIAGSLVLYLFISTANSFDRYHSHADRIYRVVTRSMGNHGMQYTQAIPRALPDAFKDEFKEVEEVVFTSYLRNSLIETIRAGEIKKYEEPKGLAFSEPAFFKIFDRKILTGSSEKGLDEPNEAIISRRWALKYFGKEDVVGELVSYDQNEYKITCVMEDFPTNTDLPFDLILSYATIKNKNGDGEWGNYSDTDNCYILLNSDEAVSAIDQQMAGFVSKYTGSDTTKTSFILQPLKELHSDNRFGNYNTKLPTQAQTIFAVIAVFLLLTACINFVNLATAEAVKRTREVGIRKILGGGRAQLIFQFLLEAFIVIGIAIFVALGGAQLLLSWLNPLMDLSLTIEPSLELIVFLAVLLFGTTVLAGMYPAWLMSSFRPTDAIRKIQTGRSGGGFMLRRGLVVLQFFISQFFMIGTLVLTAQMDFMHAMDTGFDKDNIVTVPIPKSEQPGEADKMRTLKETVIALPGVTSATLAYAPPSYKAVVSTSVSMDSRQDPFNTQVKHVDVNYIDVFGIRVLEGENLPDADTATGVLVNQKFIEVAGLSDAGSVVGKEIFMWDKRFPIRGVVNDFNTQSLSESIEPVILLNSVSDYHFLSIKLNTPDMPLALTNIEEVWKAAYPEYIFQYTHLDDQLRSLYRGETKITSMLKVFSGIAIFIGCLGLLGLVTFMANRRTKEIGVRKVLGASVQGIVLLFTTELGKLLLLGFALAAPIAGYLMNLLLQEFAYRIELGPMIFLTALVSTFIIAFLSISYRALTAAMTNPVESLKAD